MIGAIAGDIVGSVYEFHNIKTKDFPLFTDRCFFTDDSVLTIALADTLHTLRISGLSTSGIPIADMGAVFTDGHRASAPSPTTAGATVPRCESALSGLPLTIWTLYSKRPRNSLQSRTTILKGLKVGSASRQQSFLPAQGRPKKKYNTTLRLDAATI